MNERPLIGYPEPGFYTRRLRKGGIAVPVRIWRDQGGDLLVEVDGRTHNDNGEPLDVLEHWTWCCGTAITEAEYQFLLRRKAWAENHAPDHPSANATKPIDIEKLPPGW